MSEASKDYSLTLARVVLGTGALLHGIAETFHVWGGPQLGSTSMDMAQRTAMSADWLFYVVSIGLMVVGVALLLGALTRTAALLLAFVVIWHGIASGRFRAWFAPDGGCENLLALVALCVVLAVHGPGAAQVKFPKSGKQ